jgi:hypothetical protein
MLEPLPAREGVAGLALQGGVAGLQGKVLLALRCKAVLLALPARVEGLVPKAMLPYGSSPLLGKGSSPLLGIWLPCLRHVQRPVRHG